MKYFIYQLVDPQDSLPRYVGFSRNLKFRLRQHKAGDSSNLKKTAWIKELQGQGLQPIIQELEVVEGSSSEAMRREAYWINHLIRQGMPLLNGNWREWSEVPFKESYAKKTMHFAPMLLDRFEALARKQHKSQTRLLNEAIAAILAQYGVLDDKTKEVLEEFGITVPEE